MMIPAITLLIFGSGGLVQQRAAKTSEVLAIFPNSKAPEALVAARYFSRQGMDSGTASSVVEVVEVSVGKGEAEMWKDRFCKEFGYARDPKGMFTSTLTQLIIDRGGALMPLEFWKGYSNQFLPYRAYRRMVDRRHVVKSDQIVRCQYEMRPWIDEKERDCSCAVGFIIFRPLKGKDFRWYFAEPDYED